MDEVLVINGVKYVREAEKVDDFVFTEEQRENVGKIANELLCAFSWSASDQGPEYWDGVFDNLKRIADGFDNKKR